MEAPDATSEISLEDLLPSTASASTNKGSGPGKTGGGGGGIRLDVSPDLSENVIVFPKEVEDAIAAVLPSDDPLDQPNFSTVDYINQSFPTEQSLNNLDDQVTDMK